MNTTVFDPASPFERTPVRLDAAWRLRSLMIVCCAAAAGAGYAAGDPSSLLLADPELAQLLRGMAVVKALLVVCAAAALWWRFGHAVRPATAAGYIAGLAAMAVATMLVWQLSSMLVASLAFHGGLIATLVVAWRGDDAPRILRPRTIHISN